jgi:hypothetical protein
MKVVGYLFQAIGHTLKIARFSVIMVVAGGVLLLVGPGQDLMRDVAEAPYWQRQFFFLPVFLWALSAWYWARIMLSIRFDGENRPSEVTEWFRRHLPRILGSLAFLAVGIASWVAADSAGREESELRGITVIAVVYAAIFYAIVLFRRPIVQRVNVWLSKRGRVGLWIAGSLFQLPDSKTMVLYATRSELQRNTRWVLGIGLLISFAFFVAAVIDPEWLARQLGTTAVIYFLWAAICIPIGSMIVYFSNRYAVPGLTLFFLFALFCSYFSDNHAIETVENGKKVAGRPTVASALGAWIDAHKNADSPRPLIIVATAGGGSRAAYWTATVLGALEDKWPGFGDRVFAISGVSGGSVGAVVYKALHRRSRSAGAGALCRDPQTGTQISSFAECGQILLKRDFLAPTVAAMLYPDLIQRFVPYPIFNDRAHALERSLALAWADVVEGGKVSKTPFPFLDLWTQSINGGGSWPALFLNGTWVESGQRIITSNLSLQRYDSSYNENSCSGVKETNRAGEERCSINGTFVHVQDLLHRIGTDVPVWTAANNSARFPLVEPVGTLRIWSDQKRRYGMKIGHVADGGYFENYGAVTALEIVDEAVRVLMKKNMFDKFRIIVIQISSDPTVAVDWCVGNDDTSPLRMAPEVRGPLRTFMKTREARGLVAFGALCDHVERLRAKDAGAGRQPHFDRFIHLRMCPPDSDAKQASPPLSWALSKHAQMQIQSYLPIELRSGGKKAAVCADNEREFKRLKAVLDAGK